MCYAPRRTSIAVFCGPCQHAGAATGASYFAPPAETGSRFADEPCWNNANLLSPPKKKKKKKPNSLGHNALSVFQTLRRHVQ